MRTISEKLAAALHDALTEAPETDRPRVLRGFVVFLKRRQLLFRADIVLKALEEHFASHGRETFSAQAAHPVRLLDVEPEIRKDLIAGVRLTQDGYIVDASARHRLQQLHKVIKTS